MKCEVQPGAVQPISEAPAALHTHTEHTLSVCVTAAFYEWKESAVVFFNIFSRCLHPFEAGR